MIGFESIEKKEVAIMEQLERHSTCYELLNAVKQGNLELTSSILKQKPILIASVDPDEHKWSLMHHAVNNKDHAMIRLLAS